MTDTPPAPPNRNDVEVLEKSIRFQGYFRVDEYRLRHSQFEGGWGPEVSREIFERGHAAGCLLYDPDLDVLVLIEQFRPGAFAALASPWYGEDASPWLIEVVAGIIEDGEDPEEVIRREAVEEAGCEVQEIEPISHYLATPGASSESHYSFVGRVDASNVGGIHGLEEEGEDIRVFTATPEEADTWIQQGKIHNAMTMIPLLWFHRHRQRLREAWRRA